MSKKRNLIFLSLLILGVLLITSCLPKPPVTEGILKGQVIVPEGTVQTKDLTGQALPDATVKIIDLSTGDIIATTTTDANGYYQVFVPAGGPYLLEAAKDGVKLEQITCSVEVGIEYDLGTVDCVTTAAALIAQAMMDAGDNLADINCADIVADPDFDDVLSIVWSTIQAGGDPTASTLVQQAVEDFLHPPSPAAFVINIAAIPGVTTPVTGATPVTTITATAQYTGTVTWAPADDPFLGSQVYTATITLTPKAGFTLTGVAANFFTVAGAAATNPINSGVVTAVFPATAAAVINIAAIPGVTAPATGATPVTTITATAQYTGTVTWAPADDPFLGSQVYTATITFTPKAGFTLTGVAANFFTVAGTSSPATNTANSGVITAVFPATVAVINIAAIPGVTAPATGATPVTTITATAQYTGTVTWAPADDPFLGSQVYTATITFTAKAGFTLTGVAANFFTIAGATTVTNAADSGTVTAVFPETAAVVIDIAAIPGITAPVADGTPVTMITETAQYTGTVTWVPADDPFLGSQVYTATITLTPKAGFTLTGVAANFFTVAGATTDTNSADSGVVTAVFPATATVVVGDSYGGGKVAYILQSGDPGYNVSVQHGLIAATADQSIGVAWSNITSTLVGTTGTAIGTGQTNTSAIVGQTGCASGAAKLCDDLTLNTYSDWYLPSKDELNKLYINRVAIGGFAVNPYWSSSESTASSAWAQIFTSGLIQISLNKNYNFRVRAVRAF